MHYSQYKEFFDQSTTLPIKGLRGTKIDMKLITTALIMIVVSAVLVSLIFPGDKTVFGVQKIWIILGIAGLLIFVSAKIDTANIPFFVFIFSLIRYMIKRFQKKAIVAFEEVDQPQKILQFEGKIRYRDIIDTGDDIAFSMYPLHGYSEDIKGVQLEVEGATRVQYQPLMNRVSIKVGKFENLQSRIVPVKRFGKLDIEIGRGKLKFLHFKGKTHAIYEPNMNQKGGDKAGEVSHKAEVL